MRRRDFWIVALLSCVIGAGCQRTQAKPKEPEADKVRVTETTEAEVTDFEDFIGHTDPMFEVDVRARVNGYLDKVCFDDGVEVEKDTLLFEIDPRQYKATYDQTVAAIEQGEARLIRTTADHNRADALLRRNAIGREEYDRIQGDYAETKATIGSLRAAYDMAKLNLDWTKVKAPIAGRLSRRMVDPGNLVKADDTMLTTIVSLDPMYVNFDIDERTLLKLRRLVRSGRIQTRAEAEIPVLVGLVDEVSKTGEPFFPHEGTINFSDNKLEASTGTLRLRALIANPKSGGDVQLMPALNDLSSLPGEGQNLVVVAAVGKALHFRVFDSEGKMVVDVDETSVIEKTHQIDDLKGQLANLWAPHELTGNEKDRIITAVTSIVGYNSKTLMSKSRLLSPGLFVRIRLPVGTPHKSIMISERAILTDQGRKSVYVVEKRLLPDKDKDGKELKTKHEADVAVRRDIEVGSLSHGLRVVESGLKLKDRVIVDGLQRVRNLKEVKLMSDTKKQSDGKEAAKVASTPGPAAHPTIVVSEPMTPSSSPAPETPTATK